MKILLIVLYPSFKEGVSDLHLGGLLAIDFDSSSDNHNTLGSGKPILDLLGSGESEVSPLPLEASTAYGDSGGPAFAYSGRLAYSRSCFMVPRIPATVMSFLPV